MNVDHCIKFRTHDQTSKPLTNEHFCLRFNYLKPYYYWLVSHNTITFHKYFWCSQFCEFHCKPTLSGHPQGTGKWPLHGGWPLNRISSKNIFSRNKHTAGAALLVPICIKLKFRTVFSLSMRKLIYDFMTGEDWGK